MFIIRLINGLLCGTSIALNSYHSLLKHCYSCFIRYNTRVCIASRIALYFSVEQSLFAAAFVVNSGLQARNVCCGVLGFSGELICACSTPICALISAIRALLSGLDGTSGVDDATGVEVTGVDAEAAGAAGGGVVGSGIGVG